MDYVINDDYLDLDGDDDTICTTRNYNSESDEEPLSISDLCRAHKKSKQKLKCQEEEDDRDDFEKDMAQELNTTMKEIRASMQKHIPPDQGEQSSKQFYDEIYFDSDGSKSDEDAEKAAEPKKSKKKHRMLSNDELFYDPDLDDEDEAWVQNQRFKSQRGQRSSANDSNYKPEPLPESDAVLSCPACFTTLCLDCQRHEIYKNQYRAMFVFNCAVDKSELLHIELKQNKKKFKKKKKKESSEDHAAGTSNLNPTDSDSRDPTSHFNSVKCTVCNTKVGVQDLTELYHFFNVLSSY